MPGNNDVDLVLICPGHRAGVYQSLARELTAAEPPVWAGLIATYVLRKGFSVDIIDANALWLGPEEAAQMAADRKPKLIAVVVYGHNPSASTQAMPATRDLLNALGEVLPETPTLLIGGHPAALPERTLSEEPVDYVCSGEGPVSVCDLLGAINATGTLDPSRVRGIWYRKDDVPVPSLPAPLITELEDEMPEMAWHLLPMERYRAHNWQCFGGLSREPYASFYTTLGCPFKCSFCCIQAPFREGEQAIGHKGNSYRFWHPARILNQIETLVTKHGIRNIKIADEMFVLNRRHVEAICDGIIERGYDLNIWAYARVRSIQPTLLEKLKKAGVHWICLGIESGSPRVLADVQKGYKAENVFKPAEEIRAAGINIIANYLFGLPEDDRESMQQTLDLALELNCEFANIYCAMPYPGSKLYAQAVAEGWPLPETWSGYSQLAYDTLPLPTKYLKGPEVLRFRDEAFNTYYKSPAYLNMIEKKFGTETAAEIQKMTEHTLKRKYVPE